MLEDADFDDFFSTPYDSDSSSSSESSENNEKNAPKEKQKSTIDEILPEFTDDNFRESFGMSWQTCEYLIGNFENRNVARIATNENINE